MQTFLFYDIETTGLNKAFDQVLQFAAIRTDLNLREIERHEFKVKLNPDVVPSPRALLTHHIGVGDTRDGISEYDAMRQIHIIMNEPGTISLGYNTLGFDDEFLRFSFYRNLLPPYTHQYANSCARMDLYPITIMFHLYKNHILEWPRIDNEIKLKLELINNSNKLFAGRAHDAMVDVEITLALTKHFFTEKKMWDYLTGYYNKFTDEERARALPTVLESSHGKHQEGLMVLGKIGAAYYYQAPVIFLGEHKFQKGRTAWLRLDSEDLIKTTPESIKDTTFGFRKKLGEPGFILPLNSHYSAQLTHDRRELTERNKAWLKQHPDLFNQIIEYHRTFVFTNPPSVDTDAGLYINSFWTDEENSLCRQFQRVTPAEKVSLLSRIKNPTLKTLAVRLLARNFPEVLTDDLKQEYQTYLERAFSDQPENVVIDFQGNPRLTPKVALADIEMLRLNGNLSSEQTRQLTELEEYLLTQLQRVTRETNSIG
jgi:exodeoxyribonuclease-1